MDAALSACVQEIRKKRLEPRTGVIGSCEMPNVVAGNWTRWHTLKERQELFKHWAILLAFHMYISKYFHSLIHYVILSIIMQFSLYDCGLEMQFSDKGFFLGPLIPLQLQEKKISCSAYLFLEHLKHPEAAGNLIWRLPRTSSIFSP